MQNKVQEFREYRQQMNERVLAKENDAAILKRIYGVDTYAYQERSTGLSAKSKEMLGLSTSLVLRCDDCIKYHLEKCFTLGVANDEMMDLFGIANLVGGTIVIPHTRRALEYWELLNKERISPSPFDKEDKKAKYEEAILVLRSMLEDVSHPIAKMATINEVLKSRLVYYYWVGFYLSEGDRLVVGPYQGTHGCLFINMGEGVCGRAAKTEKTIIVEEIGKIDGTETKEGQQMHIACDPRCKSEIVVPVLDEEGDLLAVFDVDSLLVNAFDEVDKEYLEAIMKEFFAVSYKEEAEV